MENSNKLILDYVRITKNNSEAKKLEGKFREITSKNVMTLTSAYTHDFRNVSPEVVKTQLKILNDRDAELHQLASEYHSGCGRHFESPFYKTAVVTGYLAKEKLIEILNSVEE